MHVRIRAVRMRMRMGMNEIAMTVRVRSEIQFIRLRGGAGDPRPLGG